MRTYSEVDRLSSVYTSTMMYSITSMRTATGYTVFTLILLCTDYYAQNNEYTYSEVDRLSSVYTNTTMNFLQDNEYAYSEVDRLSSVYVSTMMYSITSMLIATGYTVCTLILLCTG